MIRVDQRSHFASNTGSLFKIAGNADFVPIGQTRPRLSALQQLACLLKTEFALGYEDWSIKKAIGAGRPNPPLRAGVPAEYV
jgi:hypothetical protein